MAHEVNKKQWCPAIYARLSNEDEDSRNKKKGASLSIEHQLDILKSYVKDKGWQAPKVFCDDDRTGTNFNRKGFQDMYAEAQQGNINVIIIKDTSRFGRNWVQSGLYFEKIEEMGIRFISIQESLDTADPKCPALKMLPFYFIFNEWHSQTTSEKIKTVFANKASQGGYLGSHAPYGYKRNPEDKQRLLVDPAAAAVVKRIFEMRLQKLSYLQIAKALNREGIPSPQAYRAEQNGKGDRSGKDGNWSNHSVKVIIKNRVYCGDVINNKSVAKSFKNPKRINNSESEWLIAKDMHEAIINREDWERCDKLSKEAHASRVRVTNHGTTHLFSGLLKCPDCGYNITIANRRGYNCGAFQKKGDTACTSHHMSGTILKELVLADIKEKAGEVMLDEEAAKKRFYALKKQSGQTQLGQNKKVLAKINKRLTEIDKLLQAAFEQSVLGNNQGANIFNTYLNKYEEEKTALRHQANQLTAAIEQQSQTEQGVDAFIALLKKHSDITELDRATAVELIDHITISKITTIPRSIVIYYNLIGRVEETE